MLDGRWEEKAIQWMGPDQWKYPGNRSLLPESMQGKSDADGPLLDNRSRSLPSFEDTSSVHGVNDRLFQWMQISVVQ